MHDSQNTILPDHQDVLIDKFNHITYLISNGKLTDSADALLELHHAELADYLDTANRKIYHVILPLIADKMNPETIAFLSDSNKQHVIKALGVKKSAKLIDNLDIEDSIDVIDSLDEDLKLAIIAKLKKERGQQIIEGFKYPENTAGRVLEKDFVSFQEHWTVGQAIDFIRRSQLSSDFHAAIVVSNRLRPVGTILLSTLLKSSRNMNISELMNKEFKVADTYTELDELVFIFKQYALTIVPVTNRQGKLVGSISIDNMLYLIEAKTESEFMHLGGVYNSDIFQDLYATVKHRFPWLFVNLITTFITSMVIHQFSDTIEKLIALAIIMPIVATMAGGAGTQAMTVTIRALASREITSANLMRVIFKEIFVCLLNGILLSFIGLILIYFLFSDVTLSFVFAAAVVINFIASGFFGSAIPIILNKLDIDPAAASGVFLTTFTDAVGYSVFLGLAFFFLV